MSALSLAGALVRAHEGCRLTAYPDGKGVWTIGWGHTGAEVQEGLTWTKEEADAQLEADLAHAAEAVARLKRRLLSDQQMAALISLVFNLGEGALARSTLLTLVNDCRWLDAAKEFLRFDRMGGQESKGLLIRRLDEAALFLRAS
jgi:lysozyme